MSLKDLHLKVEFKDVDLNEKCGELCKYFGEQLEAAKGLESSRATKSVYLTPFELECVNAFCEENNTNIVDLVRRIFLNDGAIPTSLILAISRTSKPVLKYLNLGRNGLTFNYLSKYDKLNKENFEELLKEKGVARPIRDKRLVVEEVEKHRTRKGFPSWASYAKIGLISAGIFPDKAKDVVRSHIRTDINVELTDAQKKIKKKRQEKAALARKRKPLDMKAEIRSKKLNVGTFDDEQSFIDSFVVALRSQGLSIGTIIKYRLVDEEIIEPGMANITKKNIEAIKKFKYERPEAQGDVQYYEDLKQSYFGTKRNVNNTSIVVEGRDMVFEKLGKGNFSNWVRLHVFEHYGVYPQGIASVYIKS